MITVVKIANYYHQMVLKKHRIMYRLNKLEKLPYKPIGLEKVKLMLRSINDVLAMLRRCSQRSYISVDAYGNYTITDPVFDKTVSGRFNSILGGMQV